MSVSSAPRPSLDKVDLLKLKYGVRLGRSLRGISPGIVAIAAGARLLDRLISATDEGKKRFFDPQPFPWIQEVETGFGLIRRELDAVLARGPLDRSVPR